MPQNLGRLWYLYDTIYDPPQVIEKHVQARRWHDAGQRRVELRFERAPFNLLQHTIAVGSRYTTGRKIITNPLGENIEIAIQRLDSIGTECKRSDRVPKKAGRYC
jgi:hypothetical protein